MNNKKYALIALMLLIISLTAANTQTVVVEPLLGGVYQPNTTFIYVFNYTQDHACTSVLASASATAHTNSYGKANITLNLSSLTTAPNYVCEYRNGSLRTVHTIGIGLSSNSFIAGNLTINGSIMPTTTMAQNIGSGVNRWGNLYITNVSVDNLEVSGNITGSYYFGSGMYLDGINITDGNWTGSGSINILGYTLTTSYISGLVGSIDLRGDPWWLAGTDLEIEQNLIVDGAIYSNGSRVITGIGNTRYIPLWNDTHQLNSSDIYYNGTDLYIG